MRHERVCIAQGNYHALHDCPFAQYYRCKCGAWVLWKSCPKCKTITRTEKRKQKKPKKPIAIV